MPERTQARHSKMGFVNLFILALMVSSCAPRAERIALTHEDYIRLERTPCFGSCPVYAITIRGDGETEFIGKMYVKVTGTIHGHIPLDSVYSLFDRADRMHFFDLEDRYESKKINDTITETVTDLPGRDLTVSHAGKTKTVHDYYGGPPALARFADEIDAVADVQNWTGR
jgi:hypothetical protein